MLKCLVNIAKGRVEVEIEDAPIIRIASEYCLIAHEIYSTLYATNPEYAQLFQYCVGIGIAEATSPTWDIANDPRRVATCYSVAVPTEDQQ